MKRKRPDPTIPPQDALTDAEAFGVDLSLLETNLRLSPTERLKKLQGAVEAVEDLRAAVRAAQR